MAPISVYSDIVCNIGYISEPMSAENPISEVARNGGYADMCRYRRHIGADMPISVQKLTISEVARNGYTPISADIGVISEQISA